MSDYPRCHYIRGPKSIGTNPIPEAISSIFELKPIEAMDKSKEYLAVARNPAACMDEWVVVFALWDKRPDDARWYSAGSLANGINIVIKGWVLELPCL